MIEVLDRKSAGDIAMATALFVSTETIAHVTSTQARPGNNDGGRRLHDVLTQYDCCLFDFAEVLL
jgi:hypothetical protein